MESFEVAYQLTLKALELAQPKDISLTDIGEQIAIVYQKIRQAEVKTAIPGA